MKSLRVLLAVPRYDTIGAPAEDFTAECLTVLPRIEPRAAILRLPSRALRSLGVDLARETAARWAVEKKMDAILFCDADCRISMQDAKRLLNDLGDAAILAAPIAGRGNGRRNFFPHRQAPPSGAWSSLLTQLDAGAPLDCQGTVGTGVCVVSVAALKKITRPWFLRGDAVAEFGPTLLDTADHPWDDSWFSLRAQRAGLPTRVHLGCRSGEHWDGSAVWRSSAMLVKWRETLVALAGGAGAA